MILTKPELVLMCLVLLLTTQRLVETNAKTIDGK